MKTQIKRFLLLMAFIPVAASAQALVDQSAPTAADVSAAPSIDAAKQAAIKDLLKAINADKLVDAIVSSAQMQAKQYTPAILSRTLAENTTLTEDQKRAAVQDLQKNTLPKLMEKAGKVFQSPQFRKSAMDAQYNAYAKYYTTSEIKSLTNFYRSPTGRKFIQVQDKVGRDVITSLDPYMKQSVRDISAQAQTEVTNIKPAKTK